MQTIARRRKQTFAIHNVSFDITCFWEYTSLAYTVFESFILSSKKVLLHFMVYIGCQCPTDKCFMAALFENTYLIDSLTDYIHTHICIYCIQRIRKDYTWAYLQKPLWGLQMCFSIESGLRGTWLMFQSSSQQITSLWEFDIIVFQGSQVSLPA